MNKTGTETSDKKKNKIRIGKHEFSSRLVIADIRRAKSEFDLDLSDTNRETAPIIKMMFDPLLVSEIVFALYQSRLSQFDIDSLDDLEEALEDDQLDDLREALAKAIGGFFPLLRIVYTKMQETLHGDLDSLLEAAKKAESLQDKASGSTS